MTDTESPSTERKDLLTSAQRTRALAADAARALLASAGFGGSRSAVDPEDLIMVADWILDGRRTLIETEFTGENAGPLVRDEESSSPHLTCACGETWWSTKVCFEPSVDDPRTWTATGYALPIACAACGQLAPSSTEAGR